MENIVNNPYKAPEAEVTVNTGSKLAGKLERFSAWGVFGLTFITGGIYGLYWLYNRTKKINAHVDNPIGAAFINTTLITYVIGIIASYAPGVPEEWGFVSLISVVLMFVWYYKVRNRIHQMVGAQKGTYAWIGPILTFFLNVIYLQYKINKIIDNE